MSDTAVLEAEAPADMPDSPFLKQLLLQIRAHDTYGAWEGKSDAEVLGPFIVTKAMRKEIPIIGDPDPDVLWRVEMYYAAVGLTIEKVTGKIASPMMKMSHEGFGKIMLTTGRLVVLQAFLRDIHRFGFLDIETLASKGQKLVDEGVECIERFPDAAAA
ncbi:MAG: NifX-associated nitrogen fixation protein [Rhodospirillaceae bacterium]